MPDKNYIAIDLGAESGRVMLGKLSDAGISLTEIHRFPNLQIHTPTASPNGIYCWDILRLWHEIKTGLAKAAAAVPPDSIAGIGVDTWGVDFALLDSAGNLLGNPVCYRDQRTNGMIEAVFKKLPKEKIYALTGIQTIAFNTLFQLASLAFANAPVLKAASHLLFLPDLFNYWLTGRMNTEYTIASTSQMLDATKREFSPEILNSIGISAALFPRMDFPAETASIRGLVLPSVNESLAAAKVPVIAVGSHDTASAVAAVPVQLAPVQQEELFDRLSTLPHAAEALPQTSKMQADMLKMINDRLSMHAQQQNDPGDWLFLSSGTWSLLGVETDEPFLSDKAAAYDVTNEGGVGGKIRLLKNIAGLFLLQECRREWAKAGKEWDYTELTNLAAAATPHLALLDVNDPAFSTAGDMPAKILAQCKATNQKIPTTPGEFTRVILESLAARYKTVVAMLEEITGKKFTRLHIVGGGSQNHLLNQLAANATGLKVLAGPVEATALGNILAQAITTGALPSLAAARALLGKSVGMREFSPQKD